MKKIVKSILTVSAMCGIIGATIGVPVYAESHYTRVAIVTNVNEEGTEFTDLGGNVWAVYDTDYSIGQTVELKMFDNYTNDLKDDEILKISLK